MSKESIFILAGEKSGVEHSRSFLPKLLEEFKNFDFYGVGDQEFIDQGIELLYDVKEFSSMGFSEVFQKIPFYLTARKKILSEVTKRNTKFVILIDFQTFNLSLVKKLKDSGVKKIFYFVAPQAWAWKEKRVEKLSAFTDRLFCILPFEKKWFTQRGVKNTHYVSHPILNKKYKKARETGENILILPGSRNSEVKYHLPIFTKFMEKNTKFNYILVKSKSVDPKFYERYESYFSQTFQSEELQLAIGLSRFCLASSGTVTLECGLSELPTVVCYKVSSLNEMIARRLVKYQGYVSLTNLILEEEVFPELIQERCTPYLIDKAMKDMMRNEKELRVRLKDLVNRFNENVDDTFEIIKKDILSTL